MITGLEVDQTEFSSMMVTAALIATITFAAMVLPPGGLVPPATNTVASNTTSAALPAPVIFSADGPKVLDATAGHAVMSLSNTGHANLATVMAVCLFMSFTLSLCCLVLVLSVVGVGEIRQNKKYCCRCASCVGEWRSAFVMAYVCLVLAIVFVYAAFICAAYMSFNLHLPTIKALFAVTAIMLAIPVLFLLFGPFSILRCTNRWYDSQLMRKDAADEREVRLANLPAVK
jgi:hypothetical protein